MSRSEAQKEADKKYEESRAGKRHRVWMGIVYPDSLPPEYEDEISEMHQPFWLSPIHDKDTWTKLDQNKNPKHVAGELKKPHFHWMSEYTHAVSKETVLADWGFLNGTDVEYVRDKRAMMRYFAHLDDPKKAQYSMEDVRVFGGASLDLAEEIGKHERHEKLRQMRRFIREQGILYYDTFYDYCDDCMTSWAYLLDDSSYAIERYIGSMRQRVKDEQRSTH